ncbi:hypothetical protein EVG20_g10880 [Dentipellis fragilis]|uniref:Uncharacterized protein n=1 Tax=Dentipellis fragilis TaxID=205917 RepID=A0A4Y9XPM0_9AGAM|nr:hypothetical protein EVG20_g10880 [Dentipellis fragilis]
MGQEQENCYRTLVTVLASLVCACVIRSDLVISMEKEKVIGLLSWWVIAGLTLLFATAFYCNLAVIWRIWRIDRTGQSHILVAIIEGGLLYTSSLIAYLVLFAIESNGQWIALDLITHFVPIIFCLVILQTKYHNTDEAPAALVHLVASRRPWTGVRQIFRRPKRHQFQTAVGAALSNFDAQPVEINISPITENQREDEVVDV